MTKNTYFDVYIFTCLPSQKCNSCFSFISNHRATCDVREDGGKRGGGRTLDAELSSGQGGSGIGKRGSHSFLPQLIHRIEEISVYADPSGKKCKYCQKDYSKSGLQQRKIALSNHVQSQHNDQYRHAK